MIADVIRTQRTDHGVPVAATCRTLGISQSWFYKHDGRPQTAGEERRAALDHAVTEVFGEHKGEYGSPRIHAELIERPELKSLSVNSVACSMRRQGHYGLRKRPRRCTTRPDKNGRFAKNLLKRDFKPAALNLAWCGDITEVVTWEGKLYVASVIDLYSRRLIGQAISNVADAVLVTDALKMAVAARRGEVSGVIMHTDRGTQYTSDDFIKLCVRHKITRSNSRSGSCLDNAAAESFFSRLKCEHVYRRSFRTREAASESIRGWLDRYNHVRRHSYCGFKAPAVFEAENAAISVNHDQPVTVAA